MYILLFCTDQATSNQLIPSNRNEIRRFFQRSAICDFQNCSCIHQITREQAQPQIAHILFDDTVIIRSSRLCKRINDTYTKESSISMTMFVFHKNNDYSFVETVYHQWKENAVCGYKHFYQGKKKISFGFEAMHNQCTISELMNIPLSEIIEFPATYLVINRKSGYEILLNNDLKNDSTLTFTKKDSAICPSTLDYFWPSVAKCSSYPFFEGLLDFYVISLVNSLARYPCVMKKKERRMTYLWTNLCNYYNGFQILFNLNIHSTWLFAYEEMNSFRFSLRKRCWDNILFFGDVNTLIMKKVMYRKKRQLLLNESGNFTEWLCEKGPDSKESTSFVHVSVEIIRIYLHSVMIMKLNLIDNSNNVTLMCSLIPESHYLRSEQHFLPVYDKQSQHVQMVRKTRNSTNCISKFAPNKKAFFNITYSVDMKHGPIKNHKNDKTEKSAKFLKKHLEENDDFHSKISVYLSDNEHQEARIRKTKSEIIASLLLKNITLTFKDAAENGSFNDSLGTSSERMAEQIQNRHIVLNVYSKKGTNTSQNSILKTNFKEKNQSHNFLKHERSMNSHNATSNSFTFIKKQNLIFNETKLIQNKSMRSEKIRRSADFGSGNSTRKSSTRAAFKRISSSDHQAMYLTERTKLLNFISSTSKNITLVSEEGVNLTNRKNFLTSEEILSEFKNISYRNKTKTKFNYQIVTNEDKSIDIDFFHQDQNEFCLLDKSSKINYALENRSTAFWFHDNNHLNNLAISGQEQLKHKRKERKRRNNFNKATLFNFRNVFLENNSTRRISANTFIKNKIVNNQPMIMRNISNFNINTTKNIFNSNTDAPNVKLFYNKGNKAKKKYKNNTNNVLFDIGLKLQTKRFRLKHIINQHVLNDTISQSWNLTHKCFQGINCKLPKCWCFNSNPYLHLKQIPHLIYVTFSGVVSETMRQKISYLFSDDRMNPNGCNIKSTVFVTSQNSSYGAIHWLHRRGHEIALNGLTGGNIDPELQSLQIPIQKRLLKVYAGIPEIDIRGWRNPKLNFERGKHLKYVKQYNLDYDATLSLIETRHKTSGHWPFTLDFGLENGCYSSVTCHEKKYSGLWEVPITSFMDINSTCRCLYVDSCFFRFLTAVEMYDFLVTNFIRAYTMKKPLGINLRSEWLQKNQQENFRGLQAFINFLVDLPDVYIIRISDLINWIQYPRSIKVGINLPGLGC